ncbi:MAG: hypothetical protein Q8P24_20305 [Desulfobacterales bacterium]|nr:hypothetical protein [Desulfobacterales bacterium]
MTSKVRSKLPQIFSSVGLVIGIVIALVANPARGPASDSATIVAVYLMGAGISFGCALVGGVLGLVVAACIPSERTTCPNCGSSNAVAAYKSIVDGKERPSSCPDCKHKWRLCPKCRNPITDKEAKHGTCGYCEGKIESKRQEPINEKDLAQLSETFSSRSNEDLKAIYAKRDTDEYRQEAVETVRRILVGRGELK